MQIEKIRRAKLRLWFAERSFPSKERSYISQLLKDGNPFGERTARRLENTYGMGEMFLDTPEDDEQAQQATAAGQPHYAPSPSSNGDAILQAIRLLELFHRADERGRTDMLRMAELLCGSGHHQVGSNKG